MKVVRCVIAVMLCLVLQTRDAGAEPTRARPNILLIMADDLGSNDLELTNPDHRTPHLNRLAAGGVRFTRHYTDTTCSPTRVGVLTGLDPARLGFRPVQRGIPSDVMTLPKALSQEGYNTYHIGKWHTGNVTEGRSPTQAGFDGWYGFLSQFDLRGPSLDGLHFKWPTYRDPWIQTEAKEPEKTRGHLTDLLTNEAIRTIKELNTEEAPWFVNLWYFAPHAPIEPAPRFIEKYPDNPNGHYRALIEQLDASVGRITAQLRTLGILDETLIIFMSDNGGTNEVSNNNGDLPGRKGQMVEGGVRTPLIWHWPAKLPGLRIVEEPVSMLDVLPTVAAIVGHDLTEHELAGVDLWPSIIGGAPFPERYLFWESLSHESLSYSVLDAGGRWRLVNRDGRKTLYDVGGIASEAHLNVLDEHPQVAESLEREYEVWHQRQHRIAARIETLTEDGAASISGDDIQRSPGQGGLTFGIGVTPTSVLRAPNKMQHIAGQEDFWHLSFKNGKPLTLHFLGERLDGPVLPNAKCSAIIITSYYRYSRMSPEENVGFTELYVDGALVDSVERTRPPLAPTQFSNPTVVGFRPNRNRYSQLRFGEPQLFNEWFAPAERSTSKANSIEGLNRELCAGSEAE